MHETRNSKKINTMNIIDIIWLLQWTKYWYLIEGLFWNLPTTKRNISTIRSKKSMGNTPYSTRHVYQIEATNGTIEVAFENCWILAYISLMTHHHFSKRFTWFSKSCFSILCGRFWKKKRTICPLVFWASMLTHLLIVWAWEKGLCPFILVTHGNNQRKGKRAIVLCNFLVDNLAIYIYI